MSSTMKEFRLFDGEFALVGTHEVTGMNEFRRAVEVVNQLRDRMLKESVLRKPILNLFQEVYNDDTDFPNALKANTPVAHQVSNKTKIRKIKSQPPTDQDVTNFLRNSFPDLYLVEFPKSSKKVVWGETWSGRSQANSERVSINAELTDVWLRLKNKSSSVSGPALSFLFLATFLHELAHSALVSYGEGACNTPKMGKVDREAGEYIETEFFGGIVKGVYDTQTKVIRDVGIAMPDSAQPGTDLYFTIDNERSAELLKLDTANGLPCFKLSGLSPDHNPPHTLVSKFWPIFNDDDDDGDSSRHIQESDIRPFLVADKKIIP